MCSGFSTIAGSVLLAYQKLLGDTSSILTACVMSIPMSLLVSKMRFPEKEESITKGTIRIPQQEEEEANILHAAGNGSAIGIQISLLMGAALLAIVSLFRAVDFLFGKTFPSSLLIIFRMELLSHRRVRHREPSKRGWHTYMGNDQVGSFLSLCASRIFDWYPLQRQSKSGIHVPD